MSNSTEETSIWQENRAFFQANTIKGARYLDDAGKILNEYREIYNDGQVGLEGLNLTQPNKVDYPDHVTVDINRIWMSCNGITSIKRLREHAVNITKGISRIIDVSSYKRLGFRAYYFKPIVDTEDYCHKIYPKVFSSLLSSSISAKQFTELGLNIRYESSPFRIRLILQPIIMKNLQGVTTNFTEDGFVIDIDVIEDKESSSAILNFDRLTKFIKESSDKLIQEALAIIALLDEKGE